MAHGNVKCIDWLLTLLLLVAVSLALAQPMTNDEQLVSLESSEEQPQPLTHITKIAPRAPPAAVSTDGDNTDTAQRISTDDLQTIVQELQTAGVQTAEQRPLTTLTYKELTRLLALWHATHLRSVYHAEDSMGEVEAKAGAQAENAAVLSNKHN